MKEQPEALRLAEFLEMHWCDVDMPEAKAAAELRRLSAVEAERDALKRRVEALNQALRQWLDKTEWIQETGRGSELGLHRADAVRQRLVRVEAQRDALLEACRAMLTFIERHAPRGLQPEPGSPVAKARAAIAAVEGEKE